MTRMAVLVCVAVAAAAQTAAPRFEVESVKPCRAELARPGERMGNAPRVSADRLTMRCVALKQIIQEAYLSYPDGRFNSMGMETPIEGAPGWTQTELYSIEGKAERPASRGMLMGPMLQALLEERFRLKARREVRDAAVYHLVVAKGGPKLRRFDGSCISVSDFAKEPPPEDPRNCRNSATGTTRDWRGISIDNLVLAFLLPSIVGRPVINKTRIDGLYDIHLEFSIDGSGDRPMIPTALEEQLGLRLVNARGTREVLVIERVERPAGN
jgi:uncharacterized protein (TIGR03435 family)